MFANWPHAPNPPKLSGRRMMRNYTAKIIRKMTQSGLITVNADTELLAKCAIHRGLAGTEKAVDWSKEGPKTELVYIDFIYPTDVLKEPVEAGG